MTQITHPREPESVTNCNEYMTGTFVYIKLGNLQNFLKNGCGMTCLWASENQKNWIFKSYIKHSNTIQVAQIEIWPIFWHKKQLSLMVSDILFTFEKVFA